MQIRALEQLLEWGIQNIQDYCDSISATAIQQLRDKGCFIEHADFRSKHLFGVYLPDHLEMDTVKDRFRESGISVGIRGEAIRVAPHVYNTVEDFEKFVACFK